MYEFDRIICRVISYTVVTLPLAGAFAGMVVLATTVLPFKAPAAVAASTLAAAALFNPLRRRVPRAVYRRHARSSGSGAAELRILSLSRVLRPALKSYLPT